ncbi:MAG: sugar transferase [Acidimicrobiales bacterium]|nr:sugar transferase [Acidimicrobiales bacterium]
MTSETYDDLGAAAFAGGTIGVDSELVGGYHPILVTAVDGRAADFAVSSGRARFLKRSLDLAAALPLMLGFLIVSPFIVLAIAATSRGPIFFRQVRTGRGGRQFVMYKFRTMHRDAEQRLEADPELMRAYLDNDFKVPLAQDPRVTSVGRILRKLSIDELPQVLNVVAGHMSLVGPRPIVAEQVLDLYGDDLDAYLACKPGLTGRWQVSGRSDVTKGDRAELDMAYAREWTMMGDVAILLRTVPTVLSTQGAH